MDWQSGLGNTEKVEITFHGGEPLAAGLKFYQMALPLLNEGLPPRKVSFAIQSNLWLLDEETCQLFREYQVSIGTSLDGPETINDAQRGAGYYRRTWRGIQLARLQGLAPGCICTFTAQSAQHTGEIFDFFLKAGLGFSLHAALPVIGKPGNSSGLWTGGRSLGGRSPSLPSAWTLSPEAHGELLVRMVEHYLPNASRIRISTLDAMIRSISAGTGGMCTFGDCLGEYLAVDPQGWIYPCQRMVGMAQLRLGSVYDRPSWEALQARRPGRCSKSARKALARNAAAAPISISAGAAALTTSWLSTAGNSTAACETHTARHTSGRSGTSLSGRWRMCFQSRTWPRWSMAALANAACCAKGASCRSCAAGHTRSRSPSRRAKSRRPSTREQRLP